MQIERQARELEEARQQQAASSRVLHIIGGSPGALTPVFQAILKNAVEVCGARFGGLFKMEGNLLHLVADYNLSATQRRLLQALYPMMPNLGHVSGRAILTRSTVQIPDTNADEDYKGDAKKTGFRSLLATPLLKSDRAIGSIVIYKAEPGMFPARQLNLLQNFAAQAVIAIENARLFNETREALERQTATADVLKVISRSTFDLPPALDTLISSACRLCEADLGAVRYQDGPTYRVAADYGSTPGWRDHLARQPSEPGRGSIFGRTVVDRRTIHIPDVLADPEYTRLATQKVMGYRAALGVPLIREGRVIGVLNLFRFAPGPFTEKQIELVETFADQAVIAIENVRLFNATKEALERQTATADILKVIASSPSDVQPVFEAMVASANRLIGGSSTAVFRFVDGYGHLAAFTPINPDADEKLKATFPQRIADVPMLRPAQAGEVLQIDDTEKSHERLRDIARARGFRSVLYVPLKSKETSIGVIATNRRTPGPFSAHDVQLLQTFADQAVIAIENVRLFEEVQAKTRDLEESLQQQTATGDVLKVIASSPTDVGPVLKAIVESACDLCEADDALATLRDGDDLVFMAQHGSIPVSWQRVPINRQWPSGRAVVDCKPVHVHDLLANEGEPFPDGQEMARRSNVHTVLSVPLLRENESIGAIVLRRTEVRPFNDKQIALLQTFADQAVIAIGNVRLFDEVQAKTRDLSEALTYQTGSSSILSVIASSPTDVKPVLNAIVESACELCEAYDAVVLLKDGDHLRFSAHHGPIATNIEKWPTGRGWTAGRAFLDRTPVHVHDMLSDEGAEFPDSQELSRYTGTAGMRTILAVPLLRENESIGTILLRRTEVQPFSDKQIALLQTFADQAVIAIGNVRLFDEVQAKTRDLTESLQQQTATADVLKVISRSAFDLQPVFDTIVQTARRLCDAEYATIYELRDDDKYHVVANNGADPVFLKYAVEHPMAPERGFLVGRTALERKTVHMPDCLADTEYSALEYQSMGHYRSMLGVPLLREGVSIGVIALMRTAVLPFTEKQIELVTTFADQAVIAIENVRLFEEVQAKTRDLTESLEQQTATADVLKVISASVGELEPVFKAMLVNAVTICDARFGSLYLYDGDLFTAVAFHNAPPEFAEARFGKALHPPPDSALGLVLATNQLAQVEDITTTKSYRERRDPFLVSSANLAGFRTVLSVPLLKNDKLIGAININRQEVRPFTDKQIALMQNFAAQAVIAIENARLFSALRQRTDDLTKSLDDLRTAQDRLVQTEKLASLGQLTAGIAHEIKNPLNFVNNFSALSAELTDELNDMLKPAALGDKMRGEVDELTGLLKDNLEKVVQHGKRADSIVKNMLLHSREGSREHRPADINSLLDESLNLAYHGARAEKGEFNITLQRDFDADAGTIELFPQEITRAFLNLIANGVYAATRRKNEEKEPGFEPTLRATTKNLGTTVEIRIRDNGTGIPAEVREKMFNPFFTTKPAGEGTGLGLSMTHDIIVKQHGGRIDVATELGQFTEFTIVLPRNSNLSDRDRGKA